MDATSEREDRYRALSERRIREAMDAGEFKNLSGAGRPVEIEENPFVPEDWRMAFHVLKQNGFKPDWIVLADEIEAAILHWRNAADRHFQEIRERLDKVATDPRAIHRLRDEVEALKARHNRARAGHQAALEEINRKIHFFNATVPIQSLQRPTFSLEEEMRRFADRLPAYLTY